MSTPRRGQTASLVVDTGEVPLPVEIRDKDLRLVQRAVGHEEVPLPEGVYVLSLKLPGGKITETVHLEVGRRRSVSLKPPAEPASPGMEKRTRRHPLGKGLARDEGKGPGDLRIRFRHLLAFESGRVVPAPVIEPVETDAKGLELVIRVRSREVIFAQIASPGDASVHVALPALGEGERLCRLKVVREPGGISVAALPGERIADLAARYLLAGSVAEAADLAARGLREGDPLADPVGAALAGYVMLRSGELAALQDWPEKLAHRFEALPDGAVLAGEKAARSGDHKAAQQFFREAVARGLPLFTDGYSTLLSRLRQYAAAEPAVEPLLDRLESGGLFVDFAALTLTFREEGWIALPG